ncbi:MAG: hypothetical protein M3019_09595 [Candidatus Dormibacteraeota bacterium]|nr:hypothetical protein [Candidatus Dormibacteraeota bacterium]
MLRPFSPVAMLLAAAAAMAGCSSPPASTPTLTPRPTPTLRLQTPVPSASAVAIPSGPYAVVVTNTPRQGATYDVVLIGVQGQIVTRVTAKLPLLKANQTVELPLVSASNDLVYYLDGDTEIRSLSPTGATALVKTIAPGSSSILAFAVSPDDRRIAVSLINQASDQNKDSGRGYVEDVADTANHVDLFNNTAADAFRWPVGWHGSAIVDAVGGNCNGYGGAAGCVNSYHLVNSADGRRVATVCEPPATQPANASINVSPNGLPVSGGVACVKTFYYNDQTATNAGYMLAVDWTGHSITLATADKSGQLPYGDCYLAPGATQMACTANSSQALTLIAAGASPHNLGRRYNVLGWMDATHLLVGIDSKTLAVLTTTSGAAVNLALADADKADMGGTDPGAL